MYRSRSRGWRLPLRCEENSRKSSARGSSSMPLGTSRSHAVDARSPLFFFALPRRFARTVRTARGAGCGRLPCLRFFLFIGLRKLRLWNPGHSSQAALGPNGTERNSFPTKSLCPSEPGSANSKNGLLGLMGFIAFAAEDVLAWIKISRVRVRSKCRGVRTRPAGL